MPQEEECHGQKLADIRLEPEGFGDGEGAAGQREGSTLHSPCLDRVGGIRREEVSQQRLLCPPSHQHLADVVLSFLNAPLQVGLFLL